MTVSQTSVTDAARHLDARARLACDRLGSTAASRSQLKWSVKDVTAVDLVLAAIKPRCAVCGAPTLNISGYCPAHSDLEGAA